MFHHMKGVRSNHNSGDLCFEGLVDKRCDVHPIAIDSGYRNMTRSRLTSLQERPRVIKTLELTELPRSSARGKVMFTSPQVGNFVYFCLLCKERSHHCSKTGRKNGQKRAFTLG